MINKRTLDNLQPFTNPPKHIEILDLPNHGLYHSREHITNIRNNLYKLNIEEIANYSDYVTRSSVNEQWIIEQIKCNNNRKFTKYNLLTTTAIGNIAYISLYCNNEKIKEICLNTFNEWLKFENELLLKENNICKWKTITIVGMIIGCALIFIIKKRR